MSYPASDENDPMKSTITKLRNRFKDLDSAMDPCTTRCPVLLVSVACAHDSRTKPEEAIRFPMAISSHCAAMSLDPNTYSQR